MKFLQSRFTHKGTFNLAFVGATCLFLFTHFVRREIALANNFNNYPEQLVKKQVCPSEKLLPKRSFNTTKYQIYICQGDEQNSLGYYVQLYKSSGSKMTLPISNKVGEAYFAQDDKVIYFVTPYELVITKFSKRNRAILREKVKSAIAADGQSLTRGCPDENTTFVEAETQSYIVYICGRETPDIYLAVTKNGNDKIALPLQRNNNSNGKVEDSEYIAVKGKIRYFLNRKMLKVSRDGQNLIKEKVLYWN